MGTALPQTRSTELTKPVTVQSEGPGGNGGGGQAHTLDTYGSLFKTEIHRFPSRARVLGEGGSASLWTGSQLSWMLPPFHEEEDRTALKVHLCRETQGGAHDRGLSAAGEGAPRLRLLTGFSAVGGCGLPWSWVWEKWEEGSGVPSLRLFQEKGACLGPHVVSSCVAEP